MRINSLRIKNNFLGWEFEKIDFTLNLTLLVGASGVGKTQILNAIDLLRYIANGGSVNGFEWEIAFSITSGESYIWKGEFLVLEEDKASFYSETISGRKEEIAKSKIVFEQLIDSGQNLIIDRDYEKNVFNGNPMPKLSTNQSMIHTLKEEESIQKITEALSKIKLKNHVRQVIGGLTIFTKSNLIQLKKKYKTFEDVKNSNESIRIKLLLCSEHRFKVFDTIKDRFMDVFPQVEDIRMEKIEEKEFSIIEPIVSIKEKNVPKRILENRMSSGMLRTIFHIAELYLASKGSVILIDEFENSLGVNCIDILTDDLIHENDSLQFIATSHHPYIINNIPYEYWKIVSRIGGNIKVGNASSYNLGKSKQEAFIQLTKILENRS